MEMFLGREVLHFDDARTWESWLATHYQKQEGLWLKIAKKSSGILSVNHRESLDVALCYGWIDGQAKPYDEAYYLQKFTPRRPKSTWSKVNVNKVEALIEARRMREPGLKEIEAAKADGRWSLAYELQKNATVPADFIAALDQNQQAKSCFKSLNKTNRYAFISRITTAKNSEMRRSRIQKCVVMLEEGKKSAGNGNHFISGEDCCVLRAYFANCKICSQKCTLSQIGASPERRRIFQQIRIDIGDGIAT